MAGLARSPKGDRVTVIRVKDKKEFVKEFNSHIPTKEQWERIRKAGKIFQIDE